MRKIAYIVFLSLTIASCKSSSKSTSSANAQSTTERKKMVCGDVHVDMKEPHLDWYAENNSVLSRSKEVLVLPKEYKVYSVDSTHLVEFIDAIKNNKSAKTVLPLPQPAGCRLFTVTNDTKEGTRLPSGMIKAAGKCMEQTAALNFYNNNLTIHVNWFDIEYELITKQIEGENYYIVYEKMPPPENKNKDKDPAKSQLQLTEILYDK